MHKSTTISELCKALITFNVKCQSIEKDAKNPFFKSSYATLQNIQDAIREPLIESGLSVSQHPEGDHGLTTILMHESGEWIESHYIMTPVKNDPQGIGSCITYQKRYALVSILNLSIGDPDEDGNKATFGNSTPEQPEKKSKKWMYEGTKEFNAAITKLKAGTTTLDKIKEYYILGSSVEKLLIDCTKKEVVDDSWSDSNSSHYRGK